VTQARITRLQRRVADIRAHHLHVLTTRFAKTHGVIVAEGLDAAGMLGQKGLPGARARRRGLSDSAMGRRLGYKTGWCGSTLVVVGRWYPSSKTRHVCGNVPDIGWAEHWTCQSCGTSHQRADNAAINLARYEEPGPAAGVSAVGPVRAAVKRGADRKPSLAGQVAMKRGRGSHHTVAEQPRDGVPVS
jgi:putative transposase